MLTFCKVWLWKIQPMQRETLTTFRWLLLVLLSHSNTLWSPIQGDTLGPQGCLGSTSEGQLVQVHSSPVLLFPPDRPQDPGSTKDHQVAGWSEDTHSVQELSLRNGHRWSGWVWAKGTETGRNSASMGGKGERENGERWACRGLVQGQAGESGTTVRAPGSDWLFRTIWSLWHKGNRKPIPLTLHCWPSGSPSQGLECKSKY